MTAKHTPGPWKAVRDEYVSRAHRMGAAAMWVDARPQEDLWIVEAGRASVLVGAESDARLIAAAPEMFELLMRFAALTCDEETPDAGDVLAARALCDRVEGQ